MIAKGYGIIIVRIMPSRIFYDLEGGFFWGEVELAENKKLYVGNLSFEVKEEELQELFGEVGAVESVNMITDRQSGRPKGFAFVEMSSAEEAKKAIEKFNGYSLKEREMVVNEARPRRNDQKFGGGTRFDRF